MYHDMLDNGHYQDLLREAEQRRLAAVAQKHPNAPKGRANWLLKLVKVAR